MAKVSGTVYRYKSQERIPYASVKAWKKGDDTIHVLSDDNGDFIFDHLESGKWNFVTLHEGSFPTSCPGGCANSLSSDPINHSGQ